MNKLDRDLFNYRIDPPKSSHRIYSVLCHALELWRSKLLPNIIIIILSFYPNK